MEKNQNKYCREGLAEHMLLYGVTDRTWLGDRTLYQQVEAALRGGVTMIQLREKHMDRDAFRKEAIEIRELCARWKVPFLINDDVALAKEIDADGVHVGQKDMEALEARKELGDNKIIGVSARTVEQALTAQTHGADYLGVGAVFHTGTKSDAKGISHETLQEICQAVTIPAVAIGGITGENVMELKGTGISGIAVVSAVFAAKDPEKAARDLREKLSHIVAGRPAGEEI